MTGPLLPDPPEDLLEDLLDTAREVARAAGDVALGWRDRVHALAVEEKTGPGDLVTQADRDAEQAAREVLARRRPQDAVVGEEHLATTGASGLTWYVDPIDGTTNYVYGRDEWAVSVAAVRDEDALVLAGVVAEPPYGHVTQARRGGGTLLDGHPVRVRVPTALDQVVVEVGLGRAAHRARSGRLLNTLVPRLRDVRRTGSAAIALAQVASGRVDASWGPDLQPWDLAAGLVLVSEAGGEVGDLDGPSPGRLVRSGHVLAGHPDVTAPLRRLLAPVYEGV